MQTKAAIVQPREGETVSANSDVCVRGTAWTGSGEVAKVELSADNGKTWSEAKLIGESKPHTWRFWEFDWRTPVKPGKATLIARAIDSTGGTQPLDRDADRGNYMINHLLPIGVEVK